MCGEMEVDECQSHLVELGNGRDHDIILVCTLYLLHMEKRAVRGEGVYRRELVTPGCA